jgi:PPOX class probable F420-dependent enzyme
MQAMLDPQVEGFLDGHHLARLATIDAGGYPHVTVMWYLYDRGHFYMTTTTTRVKYHNVRRTPRVGFEIDSDPFRRALVVKADVAGFIREDLAQWNRRIAARYVEPDGLDAQVAELLRAPRVILDLVPVAVVRTGSGW